MGSAKATRELQFQWSMRCGRCHQTDNTNFGEFHCSGFTATGITADVGELGTPPITSAGTVTMDFATT